MKQLVALVAAVSVLVVAATASAAGAPSVRFVTPKAHAMTGPNVTFTVKLSNFMLDAKDVGKAKRPHAGHLHFTLDGGKYDTPRYAGANGKLAAQLGTVGAYSPAVLPTISYAHLPAGKHVLVVYLANNDHTSAGAQASLAFTVR